MAGEEPPFLPVGTDVSAKYRGAFCEAKVKKLVKLVKCKVTLKDNSHVVVTDEDIKGPLKTGLTVEVKHPESGQITEGTINKITDHSTYTVVFDDGDENTLRRTQLCLKGEKHFVKSETLDQLPLTHPEHFGTPVMKPKRRRGANQDYDTESDDDSSVESEPPKREYKGRLAEMIGRIVMVEIEDRKKAMWVPVLVVDPNANDLDLKTKDHLLVKSFKDSKFYSVVKKDTKEFTRETATKNEDKLLKNSFEKALAYFDSKDLPSNWDKDELLGCDSEDGSDCESSDDEPSEEKDRFVAQLYKFMDDRGTPINKTPVISSKDVNLYRLFRVVQNLGGYNRVTNQVKWKSIYSKMGMPSCNTGANQVKAIYKKYLHAFEDFYRKLGSSMGTISRPNRNRHSSGRGLLSSREREIPRSPRADKSEKDKQKAEKATEAEVEKGPVPSKTEKKQDDKKGEDSENDSPRKSSRIRKATVDDKGAEEEERKLPEMTKPVTRVETARLAREDAKPSKEETAKGKEKKEPKAREDTPSKRGRVEEPRSAVKDDAKKTVSKKVQEDEKKIIKEDATKVKEEPVKVVNKDDKEELKPKKGRKRLKDDEKDQSENVKKKKKAEERDFDDEKDVEGDDEEEEHEDGEDEDGDTPREPVKLRRRKEPELEYGIGSKLKVRYGRGRNIKTYEAKILEADAENGTMHYLVHYSGWNNRYDEWVMKDRIVGLVELVEPSKVPPIKPKGAKKKGRPSSSGNSTPTHTPSESPKPSSARTKSPIHAVPPSKSRLTRQTSVEQTTTPSLRRSRRASSSLQETQDAQSHVSESDSDDRSMKEERDDALSIAESTDSKRPPSPEPPKLKEEVTMLVPEVSTESSSPVKQPSPVVVQSPVKQESPEKMDTSLTVNEPEPPEVTPVPESVQSEVPVLEQVKVEEQEKEVENESVPELVMQTEETPVRPLAGLEATDDDKDSQPPVIDKEVHTTEEEMSSQAEEVQKQEEKVKEVKKSKKGKKKALEAKKEDCPEKLEPVETSVVEKVEPPTESQVEAPSEKVEKEIVSPQESPEKEDKGKKAKGEKKGEKKKGNLGKKSEKKDEVKGEEGEKKVDPEKKKVKKKTKKKEEEDKSKVPEKKKSSEPRSGFDIYDFKEESQDSEQQALLGLASLHNVCLASGPPNNVAEAMESQPVSISQRNDSTFRDALALVAPCSSSGSASHQEMQGLASTSVSYRVSQDGQVAMAPVNPAPSSSFASNTASASMVYDNTPPDTPEHSEGGLSPQVMVSPSRQGDVALQKNSEESLQEPIAHPTPLGGDSPSGCDLSTISNSSGGSSGNLPSGESSGEGGSKRKRETEVETTPGKKRRRSSKRGQPVEKPKSTTKTSVSDSDDASNAEAATNAAYASPSRKNVINPHNIVLPPNRPPKFNFNLDEGKNYEGEKRISFLSDKMQEIRKMYMQLKAEVACIDRRRKRARRKEKEANASHSNGQNQSHNPAAGICYAS